jgi:hypothetical protein
MYIYTHEYIYLLINNPQFECNFIALYYDLHENVINLLEVDIMKIESLYMHLNCLQSHAHNRV